MKPYVLQRWCPSGEFLGCWAADSDEMLASMIYEWMRRMEARGYDVRPFPGGVVACRRDRVEGKLQPVRMIIVEPQQCALEAVPLPAWMAARVPDGGSAEGRAR
ncbi:MAG: hypothetical protein ACMVO3_22820 [Thalassobaculum sp.]